MKEKEAMVATHFLPEGMTLKEYEKRCGGKKSLICPKCSKRIGFLKKFFDIRSGTFKDEDKVVCLECLSLVNVKTGKIIASEPAGPPLCGEDVIDMSGADGYGPL